MERTFRLLRLLIACCLVMPTLQASATYQTLTSAIKLQHAGYVTHCKASYKNDIYARTAGAIGLFLGARYLFGTTPTDVQTTKLVCTAVCGITAFYTYSESQRHKRVAAFYLLQKRNTQRDLATYTKKLALLNTHAMLEKHRRSTLSPEHIAQQARINAARRALKACGVDTTNNSQKPESC